MENIKTNHFLQFNQFNHGLFGNHSPSTIVDFFGKHDTYSGSFSSLSCALELSALPWWHSCVVLCRFMVMGTTPTRTYPKHLRRFRDHSGERETGVWNLIMKVKHMKTMMTLLYQQPIMMNTFGVQDQIINPKLDLQTAVLLLTGDGYLYTYILWRRKCTCILRRNEVIYALTYVYHSVPIFCALF